MKPRLILWATFVAIALLIVAAVYYCHLLLLAK